MERCRRLIESWIDNARVGQSDGWDAYPVSRRVVNWIYAYTLAAGHLDSDSRQGNTSLISDDGSGPSSKAASSASDDQLFVERWRASIHRQLDYLDSNLEFHLLANHLLANVRALVIGGLFFDNQRWLRRGERLLWREMDEQILDDGGHYERSPMYHALALSDLLECVRLLTACGRPIPANTMPRLRRMAAFLAALSYDDGTLALFNDSANTAETRPGPILDTARHICGAADDPLPGIFPQSGYHLWSSPDGDEKIIVDAGPPSVIYNAAHAHCDMLSFELRLGGRPWFIDSGVHGYGGDRFREYCRSTRAHNTLMIEGSEQSEVWGTFRLGRPAKMIAAASHGEESRWRFDGACHPHFDRDIEHHRRIERFTDGSWLFEDRLRGRPELTVRSFLHLPCEVSITPHRDGGLTLRRKSVVRQFIPFGNLTLSIHEADDESVEGWVFPDFGVALPGRMIILTGRVRDDQPFGFRI